MSVENEIQELERKLELKKAYLNVNISFGKGYKSWSDEVRQEVEFSLRDCAAKLAAGVSVQKSEQFSEQEIEVLKAVAASVLTKPSKTAPKGPQQVEDSSFKGEVAKLTTEKPTDLTNAKAQITMVDGVPSEQRQKIAPEAVVTVLSQRSDRFFVEDDKGNRFWILNEFLNFDYQEGEKDVS